MAEIENNTLTTKAQPGAFKVAAIEPIEIVPGVNLQLICGDKTMMSFVTIQPGAIVPLHSHPHEQMGAGVEGEMLLYIGGLEPEHCHIIRAGDSYLIPGGVPHSAKPLGDKACVALDIFSPPREDYVEQFRTLYQKEVPGRAQL
ncbi:MAG TPA: cupin domain-containing protein [Chloroflexia bacterium]|nr:cupin domain-containing protein [Chloroflexia bacterium]